jgi:hypothetical protein
MMLPRLSGLQEEQGVLQGLQEGQKPQEEQGLQEGQEPQEEQGLQVEQRVLQIVQQSLQE